MADIPIPTVPTRFERRNRICRVRTNPLDVWTTWTSSTSLDFIVWKLKPSPKAFHKTLKSRIERHRFVDTSATSLGRAAIASGSFQDNVGETLSVDQCTVSRRVEEVTHAFLRLEILSNLPLL